MTIEFFGAVSEEDRQKPKPAFSPELIDPAACVYRVAFGPLRAINVNVGGIPWDEVSGDPGPGQWAADPKNGTFQLGGVTFGGEVRCDAEMADSS